jgi:hypothetical protein
VRYHLPRLIERYGIDAKLFDWSDEITADCPRRQAREFERPVRRPVPGPVEGGVGFEIAYQDYRFQMGKLESHLVRLRDSWNIVSSVTVAKASGC